MIKVGKKNRRYSDVIFDSHGFADAAHFLPADFDLCTLKTDIRIRHGWHTGTIWDGLRLGEKEKVISWKRHSE